MGSALVHCCYGISYRDLEEMMAERGVAVDHVTLYRLGAVLRPGAGEAGPTKNSDPLLLPPLPT